MKKLRMTPEEKDALMRQIRDKFELDCKADIGTFDFTKKDVEEFIKTSLQVESKGRPLIGVSADIYCKMMTLVQQSPTEISWHALVKRNKDKNVYLIYDLLLFPQINGATSTTTDEDKFAEWQMDLIKDPKFPYEDLRCHMHSHVNMAVFSSGVDDQYQKDILTNLKDGDYYLFLVLNKRSEICILLYDYETYTLYETEDVDFVIMDAKGESITHWANKQVREYCETMKPQPVAFNKYIPGKNVLDDYEGYPITDEEYFGVTKTNKRKRGGKRKNGLK